MTESAHGSNHDPASDERAAAEQELAAAVEMLQRGAPDELHRLIPAVYAELRRLAHYQLARETDGHTLSTTALVHEAYLRLADHGGVKFASRTHFLALAARAMRRVLVDYARRHQAVRRGGPHRRGVSLEDAENRSDADALRVAARGDELIALDEALERLARVDPRAARVVECRFFGGLSEAETAEVLGVSRRTVAGDWLVARGWLYQALRPQDS